MIKTLTAYTAEIDDPEIAVKEVLNQLDLKRTLLANSLGVLTCYPEFLDTGVVKAICAALPFDVIGCTSMGNGANGKTGHLLLTLMVITADDVSFSARLSAPLGSEQEIPLRKMYDDAAAALPQKPVFMLSFSPLIFNVSGEVFLETLDGITGGLPNFGTLAVDHTLDYSQSRTIFNGDVYTENMVTALFGGNIKPVFIVESLSEEKTRKQKAIITDSEGNILKEVNGIPVIEYMAGLGLIKDGQIEGPNTIPFVVDFGDGTKPVTRAIFAQTPEGYAVCGGSMPVNSSLSIGNIDYDDVMKTSSDILKQISEAPSLNGAILFSCVGRNYSLGTNSLDELDLVNEHLEGELPYQMAYSGGELCPLADAGDQLRNRFHNDTIVACIF